MKPLEVEGQFGELLERFEAPFAWRGIAASATNLERARYRTHPVLLLSTQQIRILLSLFRGFLPCDLERNTIVVSCGVLSQDLAFQRQRVLVWCLLIARETHHMEVTYPWRCNNRSPGRRRPLLHRHLRIQNRNPPVTHSRPF